MVARVDNQSCQAAGVRPLIEPSRRPDDLIRENWINTSINKYLPGSASKNSIITKQPPPDHANL
jgi:hypothetical protein